MQFSVSKKCLLDWFSIDPGLDDGFAEEEKPTLGVSSTTDELLV